MNTYTITPVTGAPDWSAIPTMELNCPYNHELTDTPVRARAQIAYSDAALLVRLQATEPNIRAQLTGLNDEVCTDSCLEFFFCPMEGDERYFNIEFNPNCARYLGFGSGLSDLVRLIPDEDNDGFCPHAEQTDDGWFITYQVPFSFIRRFFPDFKVFSGKTIRANCYKCGDLTVQPHWLSWQQLTFAPGQFTFHLPNRFGQMVFG